MKAGEFVDLVPLLVGKHFSQNKHPSKIMNIRTVMAVVLVALGIVVLAYSGLNVKTPGKPIDFLGIHIQTTENHFIPPAVGALMLVGGIVLLVVKPKQI